MCFPWRDGYVLFTGSFNVNPETKFVVIKAGVRLNLFAKWPWKRMRENSEVIFFYLKFYVFYVFINIPNSKCKTKILDFLSTRLSHVNFKPQNDFWPSFTISLSFPIYRTFKSTETARKPCVKKQIFLPSILYKL